MKSESGCSDQPQQQERFRRTRGEHEKKEDGTVQNRYSKRGPWKICVGEILGKTIPHEAKLRLIKG
jgi:hypothetical protein